MDERRQQLLSSVGLLVLRLGAGGYMVLGHGWGKLQKVLAGQLDQFGDPIGLGPAASLVLITFAEFLCALLVVAGAATRLAAVSLVIGMLVAAFAAHGADPWTMAEGARLFKTGAAKAWSSKEPALLYGAAFLTLVFTGAGRLSVDALVWPAWRRRLGRRG